MSGWLKTFTHLNPLTYVLAAMRTFMLAGRHISNSRFGFVVAQTQSYLPEPGADFEQVLVSTVSR
jgi:hypothetical protein